MKSILPKQTDCRRVGDLLSQYADGELSATRRAQVQAHLDACPRCATRLQALHSAISFLEADAKTPLPAMPDLYAGFRERLVTQPSGSSPLARRAQRAGGAWHLARVGMVGGSLVAAGSVSLVWHRRAAVLNEAIQGLRLPNNNPTFLRIVEQGNGAYFAQGYLAPVALTRSYRQADTLWSSGSQCIYTTVTNSKQHFRTTNIITPGGVGLTWSKSLDTTKLPPVIRLFWNPADPQHPQNEELKFSLDMFRHWLKQLAHSNKLLFVPIETAQETIGGERFDKLTIRHLNTTIAEKPLGNGEYFEPNTLVLWFDANKRLRQYRQEFQTGKGRERSEQGTIAYDQTMPVDVANVPVPKDWFVTGSMDSPPQTGSPSKPIPVANILNPVWRTMPDAEKQAMQSVADRFARAWASRDAAQLRPLVDLNRPLEVATSTRPHLVSAGPITPNSVAATITPNSVTRKVALVNEENFTPEDIWQRVWAKRLSQEPPRRDYHIALVYAYDAANKPLLDKVPLTIATGRTYAALPGMNALAWVSETDQDGRQSGYAARLFLVKRGGEWKVWQFAREPVNPTPGGWDADE